MFSPNISFCILFYSSYKSSSLEIMRNGKLSENRLFSKQAEEIEMISTTSFSVVCHLSQMCVIVLHILWSIINPRWIWIKFAQKMSSCCLLRVIISSISCITIHFVREICQKRTPKVLVLMQSLLCAHG